MSSVSQLAYHQHFRFSIQRHFLAQINKDSLLESLKCCSHAPCTPAHSAPVNKNCPRVDYSLSKCFINADIYQTSAYVSLQTLLYGLQWAQWLFNCNNQHTMDKNRIKISDLKQNIDDKQKPQKPEKQMFISLEWTLYIVYKQYFG